MTLLKPEYLCTYTHLPNDLNATKFSSSPPTERSAETAEIVASPLLIQTTQQVGLGVPIGLIVTELRTSPEQSLVLDSENQTVFLETNDSSNIAPESILETSIVRDILNNGFTTQT